MRIIAGEWGGRRIQAPAGRETRPTSDRVREAWMSAVAPHLEGARVLDLFAGSGALALEALSRGASRATVVENHPGSLRVLQANLDALGARDRVDVVRADAVRFAERLDVDAFDLAFADPPYGKGMAAAVVRHWMEVPFAPVLCVEHGRGDALPPSPNARERRYGDTVLTFLAIER